jgi:hypothetical protein
MYTALWIIEISLGGASFEEIGQTETKSASFET